jgi:hypothetical protein
MLSKKIFLFRVSTVWDFTLCVKVKREHDVVAVAFIINARSECASPDFYETRTP